MSGESILVESAMDAIVATDEAQKVILFNRAAERIFGYARRDVLGKPLDMLLPARFRAAHRGHVQRFGETGTTSRDMGGTGLALAALHAHGHEFPIEASISQHVADGRKVFTVILRDVTDRVRSANLLARGEARMRGIVESAMDAIITVDEEERVVLFNNAAEVVFGWPRDEAIGQRLDAFIPERFRAEHHAHLKRFAQAGVSSRRMGGSRIVSGLRRGGEKFPIDASISQIVEDGRRFFTVILRDVTQRVRDEEALRRSREEIRELAIAATTAREQEKSRIARELHDEMGQALTALKIDLGFLRERASSAGPEVRDKLEAMQTLLDTTVAAARRISSDLRPLMLDDLGLGAATEWLVQGFTRRTGVPCELDALEKDLELEDPYATAVFRVLQESLTNIAKHAGARHVSVSVRRDGGEIVLEVRDDGRGFSPEATRKPGSFGLLGLRERASLLGGEVAIESAPGAGTAVRFRMPLDPAGGSAP